jgi:hypothetical protein
MDDRTRQNPAYMTGPFPSPQKARSNTAALTPDERAAAVAVI